MDIEATQERIETVVEDRCADDDTQSIKVVNNVIGHAVSSKHGRQETCSTTNSVVVQILNGEEAENTSGLEGTSNIVHELVVPPGLNVQSTRGND